MGLYSDYGYDIQPSSVRSKVCKVNRRLVVGGLHYIVLTYSMDFVFRGVLDGSRFTTLSPECVEITDARADTVQGPPPSS